MKRAAPHKGRGEIVGNNNPISKPPLPRDQDITTVTLLRLYIGNRATGIALHPDPRWPGMWRVQDSAGHLASDIFSLTCAKDAAISWARSRGLSATEVVRWHRRETAREARRTRQMKLPLEG